MKLTNETSNNRVNRIQILQIEDEVEYIINNIDFMMDPEIVTPFFTWSNTGPDEIQAA